MADDSPPGGATIERDAHTQQFVTVHNRVARDKRLKRASRGLLVEVLSLPPGVRITFEVLAANGPEGREALRTMIRELEKYGYVVRKTARDDKGRFWTRYIFRETPVAGQTDGNLPSADGSVPSVPASENPHWTPPAKTQEIPVQDQRGFSASGNPSPKDFKEELLKDIKDGADPPPAAAGPPGADVLSLMIQGEIRELTAASITLGAAAAIGRKILAQRAEPPEHPVEWVRAVLRATPNPRSFLPTPTPAKFTAPPPAPPVSPASIEAAHAAIAHLKRAPKTGDPLRDLAAQQLADLAEARKTDGHQAA